MNALDWVVLLVTMVGIALYGVWRTQGRRSLETYLHGAGDTKWFVVGLSVMATQASAITFLSTPGQGYESGLRFVQNYFGAPFALIVISAVFLPIYRRLKVYTAYEYLGQRFDSKTRLLGAGLFLLQRGLGAGITIYAPAIVLSTVLGWSLSLTILASGLLVIAYTVAGGSDAVSHTQKYQLAVIFAGMIAAFAVLVHKLPVGFSNALAIAGGLGKLHAVDFSPNPRERYTFWSGLLGGFFLALSYFGTDQSQVQRYLTTSSLRESRLGLMFNAVCKIPMQFGILLLGSLLFVFYQLHPAPMFFDQAKQASFAYSSNPERRLIEAEFDGVEAVKAEIARQWLDSRDREHPDEHLSLRNHLLTLRDMDVDLRTRAREVVKVDSPSAAKANDADYVFVYFILHELPHGLIGLLVAAFFAATLSSKAAELNALASTTTVDVYRHIVRRDASDRHYVLASKAFTIFWGVVAISFALFASMAENLIQATNILGSIFYGVVLGLFLVAFFLRYIRGTAAFWAAILAQLLVFVLYYWLTISYLWYNVIGCAACVAIAIALQAVIGSPPERRGFEVLPAPHTAT